VDPPSHFLVGGASIDQIDLSLLNGPCAVVGVDPARSEVGPNDLVGVPPGASRILFRTANSDRWARGEDFFPDYVALTPSTAEELVRRGVRLVGIDALSIECDPSGRFPIHHTLLGQGTLILEGLLLAGVVPGMYELECLPLRIRDGDGGPARAVLCAP
jgi:arylformamidase